MEHEVAPTLGPLLGSPVEKGWGEGGPGPPWGSLGPWGLEVKKYVFSIFSFGTISLAPPPISLAFVGTTHV